LIQTFPPNFKWAGNKTETEQMIGNAVPVKLAEHVANALNEYIASERQFMIDYGAFYVWLSHAKAVSERTKRDIVSRLKRADSFCAILSDPEEYYIFMLEQTESFKALPVSVRSQLKRAVGLYSDYLKSCASKIAYRPDTR
jgi:DNA (cytosine-5)-methyltransferase 1